MSRRGGDRCRGTSRRSHEARRSHHRSGKLTGYLLVKRPRGDKSGFLGLAGFTAVNPGSLRAELLALAARSEAVEQETDQFGTRYRLEGVLTGPTGVELAVATIWLRKADGRVHFVTLIPRPRSE